MSGYKWRCPICDPLDVWHNAYNYEAALEAQEKHWQQEHNTDGEAA